MPVDSGTDKVKGRFREQKVWNLGDDGFKDQTGRPVAPSTGMWM